MAGTSSATQNLPLLSSTDTSRVVIDFGSCSFKAGFSSEPRPRAVLPAWEVTSAATSRRRKEQETDEDRDAAAGVGIVDSVALGERMRAVLELACER
jgi:actin-related protein